MGWIYMLKNKINGKKYIGQTSQTIEERLKQHRKKITAVGVCAMPFNNMDGITSK